jgi:uncharacterized membrane protein (Fun14 family)
MRPDVAVIVGVFIAALAYLEYQRIIQVDWTSIQALSQNGVTMITNAVYVYFTRGSHGNIGI